MNTLALGEDTFKRWVRDTNNLKPNQNDSDAEMAQETGEITEPETVRELTKSSKKTEIVLKLGFSNCLKFQAIIADLHLIKFMLSQHSDRNSTCLPFTRNGVSLVT